jgi:hypothetical protein
LICVCVLLGFAALAYAGVWPDSWGIAPNGSLVVALVYLELAVAVLIPSPTPGRDRATLAANAAGMAACAAAAGAAVLLFGYLTTTTPGLDTRPLSLSAWLGAGGVLAGAAALGRGARESARVLLLATFGLPALFHYLSLEYSGASQIWLANLSPHWLIALGRPGPAWWLVGVGALGWLIAAVLSFRKRSTT